MAPLSFDVSSAAGLKALNEHLASRSYVSGYAASRDDLAVYLAMAAPAASLPHAARWYKHITAILASSFPGAATGVSVAGASAAAAPAQAPTPAAAAKPAKAPKGDDDEDDDDLDLFGDLTPEEEAAQAEKKAALEKAHARAAEKMLLNKSMIVLNVKPWDDETDMAKLEAHVRATGTQYGDGLLWGSSKLVPVGFGIKMLQITAVIQDSKVPSFDAIIEDEIVQDGENEFCQSADIASFNKL